MGRLFTCALFLFALLVLSPSNAQTRDAWIRSCQAKDSNSSGSIGYRICMGQYLELLQRQQAALLKKVGIRFAEAPDEGTDSKAATQHFAESQKFWLRYVHEHCEIAQNMFRLGNASGDAAGTDKPFDTKSHRNGASAKTVLTEDGPLRIEVPRDRSGSFEPILIRKHERRFTGFDDKIAGMYARGMTVREIQGFLAEQYATEVSPDLISSVTDAVMSEVTAWQARALESQGSARAGSAGIGVLV